MYNYGFHAKDSWFFKRTVSGGVRISKTRGPADGPIVAEVELPAELWASIVASVSVAGETGESWKQALAFHGKK